jgi:hypothetical protein
VSPWPKARLLFAKLKRILQKAKLTPEKLLRENAALTVFPVERTPIRILDETEGGPVPIPWVRVPHVYEKGLDRQAFSFESSGT